MRAAAVVLTAAPTAEVVSVAAQRAVVVTVAVVTAAAAGKLRRRLWWDSSGWRRFAAGRFCFVNREYPAGRNLEGGRSPKRRLPTQEQFSIATMSEHIDAGRGHQPRHHCGTAAQSTRARKSISRYNSIIP